MRNRVIGIALGLLLGLIILVLQGWLTVPKKWNLLQENEGQIISIALQYVSSTDELMLPVYKAFLKQISPDVEVIAICGNASEAQRFRQHIEDWKLDYPERVKTVVVGANITGWCKDRFLVARSSKNILVCPTTDKSGLGTRINDALVAPAVADTFPKRFVSTHSDLNFDAGDFLQTRSSVIVSDVLWRRNGNPHEFRKKLSEMFTQKVVYLHGAPDHHIGMYAAPIDEHTAVVGDPRMAQKLWNPRMEAKFGHADFSQSMINQFDQAAKQLKASGFKLIRAPLIVLGPRVYITYTNGIFETQTSHHIAYMPTYGIPELDHAGELAFKAAGCDVRLIPVGKLYKFRGTIGCMINVLDRR